MKYILILIILSTLASCNINEQMNANEKNKKQNKIIMDVTTKPKITINK